MYKIFKHPGFVIPLFVLALSLVFTFQAASQNGGEVRIKLFNPQPKPDSVVSSEDLVISANLTWEMLSDALNAVEFKPPQIKFVVDSVDVSEQVKIELSPLDIFPPIYIISYVPKEPLKPGGHSVVVSTIDSAGNATTLPWKFIVKQDGEEPISIGDVYPQPGSVLPFNEISIGAYICAKNGVDPNSVKMLLNDKPVKPNIIKVEANYVVVKVSYEPEGAFIDGHHKVNISAADYEGEAATVECRFTVDTTPPSIRPLEPQPEQTVQHPQPLIKAELREIISGGFMPPWEYPIPGGSGLDIESLAMSLDGKQVKPNISGNIIADAPLELRHVTYRPAEPLTDGKHEVILKVKDRAELTASTTWSFVVKTEEPPGNTNAIIIAGVEYRITFAKKEYLLGEPIPMAFRVTNLSDREVTFVFSSSQLYDFLVYQHGKVVWRWSDSKGFLTVITEKKLAPGDVLEFKEVWKQTDTHGNPARPGRYQAFGVFTIANNLPTFDGETGAFAPVQPRVGVDVVIKEEDSTGHGILD